MPEMDGLEATAAIRKQGTCDWPAHSDHRHDGPRDERRSGTMPGRGHGRLPRKASGLQEPAANSSSVGAPAQSQVRPTDAVPHRAQTAVARRQINRIQKLAPTNGPAVATDVFDMYGIACPSRRRHGPARGNDRTLPLELAAVVDGDRVGRGLSRWRENQPRGPHAQGRAQEHVCHRVRRCGMELETIGKAGDFERAEQSLEPYKQISTDCSPC